jgi:23S rRNA (cytosine1962-C5)-methyltransferase
MGAVLSLAVKERFGGFVEASEVGIPISASKIALPCGAAARWTAVKQ